MESNLDRRQEGHPTGSTLMAALDQELSPQQNSAVEEHVTKCPQCSLQWERLQQVSARLTDFHQSLSTLPQFELHLPANEERTPMVGGILASLRRRELFMPAAALATAVIGLILWTNSRASVSPIKSPVPPVIQARTETATMTASKAPIQAASQTQTAVIRPPRSAATSQQADVLRHAPNPKPNAAQPQTAEVFWYLPYSNPALAAEGAELVHADLPREAFLMAGVPLANIPAAGPQDRIAADIVIGADGLPRAIRPARQQTTATETPTRL